MAIEDNKDYTLKGSQVKDLAGRVKENASDIAGLETTVAGKQDALSVTQLAAVNSGIDATKVAQISTNATDIDGIEVKIPAQATSSNQLADKAFVNSSVATNTANFVGTFNTIEELEAVQNPTNNDYGFVIGTDSSGNTVYNRYKFNGTAWVFEYALNNSSFTAEQWAAIQSGITAGLVTKLNGIEAGAEVNTIESISVNGTPVTPDANKNVNLTIDEGIKTLTTADYNYPTDNPAYVGLWLLDSGFYRIGETMAVRGLSGSSGPNVNIGDIIIISKSSTLTKAIVLSTADSNRVKIYNTTPTGGNSAYSTTLGNQDIITVRDINATLTSTSNNLPLAASQGKVLKDLIDSIAIRGAGAPTTSTVGTVGQLYEDGTNGALYQLKSIDITVTPNTYNWEEVGGGSSVNVVQTTGTSTTDVMSQNAVTRMIYNQPNNLSTSNIRIGQGVSSTLGSRAIAIATQTNYVSTVAGANAIGIGFIPATNADNAIAIGARANATGAYSIAFGGDSSATAAGEMNIGAYRQGVGNMGYNGSAYRLLSGLYDPQSDHDAATKGYVDANSASAFTTNEWNALWS